jgi:hypothetical protein
MIALVVGGAECVWKDAYDALQLFTPDAIIAIKDQIVRWPLRIDYAVNLHPERSDYYMRERRHRNMPCQFDIWSYKEVRGDTKHRLTGDWSGSSGLFAVKVALEQGFNGIVLTGVPMKEDAGHFVRKHDWPSASNFRNGWVHHEKDIKQFVRSMSGWTRELFGEPTPRWLTELGSAPPNHEMVKALQELADGPIENSTRKLG